MRGMWSGYISGGAKPHLQLAMQGQVGSLCLPVRLELLAHRPSQISVKYSGFQAG